MIADWILERMHQRLIIRFDLQKSLRRDYWPAEFRGVLFAYTDRGRTPAGGFVSFRVQDTRLDHFIVEAHSDEALIESRVRYWSDHWDRPWSDEVEHVFKISHMNVMGNEDQVPMSSILAVQHLALTKGLLYQAERRSHTGLQRALLKHIAYQFDRVMAEANAKLFLGIL